MAQFIQCLVVPFVYHVPLAYSIYVAKANMYTWVTDVTSIRIWLLIEVSFFFFWILSGILFLTFSYIVKIKSVSKNEKLLLLDDNAWNDKDSDDFLRYVKQEYFMFSFIICFLLMELSIGFTNYYELTGLGDRNLWPIRACFLLLITARVSTLT